MAGPKVTLVMLVGAALLASCLGVPQYPPPPHPYAPAPSYKEPARPYNYAYSVNDDYKGLRFGADEASDGNTVKGSYNVDLPDGRKQQVDYTADHYAGYNAEVTYTGEAKYPHHPPPASYHPAPAPYHPPAPYHG
ncbi:cuticle protein 7-like [Panulirus ornatus]|uniref:cuticle protein 7-like n=1 Tax=Panulirus ornatus TaxID=150431 RepID=UPI003A83ACAE